MHDNNPHRENYTPEPLPFKTGCYEYFAGAILGAILAVLILHFFGVLFVPA
jgi:hypothetical protein